MMKSFEKNPLIKLNNEIKAEADDLLFKRGLLNILNEYGIPSVTGSYSLDLMTWRDLDIYLETEFISESDFFLFGSKIANLLKPVKMNYRNELIQKTNGLPEGLYWGVYLGNEREGAWKIDIWAVNDNECKKLLKYCNDIKTRLSLETSLNILEIKSKCWTDPSYRKTYSSSDIYDAVLNKGISDINEFTEYLQLKKKN